MMKMYAHYDDFDQDWVWLNFSPKELSCKCCGEYFHDPESLNRLQTAREISGKPYKINSAHRCVKHNRKVGGMPRSMHLNIAFDVSLNGHDKQELLQALFDGGFSTFGLYSRFIHTDKRPYRLWYGTSKVVWGDIYNQVIRSHD